MKELQRGAERGRPPPLLSLWRGSCQRGRTRGEGGREERDGGSIFNHSPHCLLMSGCLVRPGVVFNV